MRRILIAAAATVLATGAGAAEDRLLSRPQIEPIMKSADCDVSVREAVQAQDVKTIDAEHKLVEVNCWRAAYNFGSLYFVVDTRKPGGARPVQFKTWGGKKFILSPSLSNPDYDEKTRTLSGFHKGRGAGDCGEASEWTWDGTTFQMTGYWSKPKCDGEPFDYFEDRKKWRIFPPRK